MDGLNPAQLEMVRKIAKLQNVESIRVFGSRARGTSTPQSDLDVLVKFSKVVSLLDVIALKQALEEALGLKVDVVQEGGLSPNLKERILSEAIAI